MPDHKTHVVVGAIFAAIVFAIVNATKIVPVELKSFDWIMLVLITYIYSQLPDIDADTSVINKIWNVTAGLGGIYCLYTGQYKIFGMFAIASIIALELVKHRGVTHEEWFGAIMAAPLWTINPLFAIVAITTFLSHTIIDGEFLDKELF